MSPLNSPNLDSLPLEIVYQVIKEQISEGLRPGFEELFIEDEKMVANDYQTLISGLTCEYRVVRADNYNATIDIPSMRYNLEIYAMKGAVEVVPHMKAADIARMNNQDF